MKSTTFLTAALMAASQIYGAMAGTPVLDNRVPTKIAPRNGKQSPSEPPRPDAQTPHGCYSSAGNMTEWKESIDFFASGSCGDACRTKKYWSMAVKGSSCYCGYAYPPKADHLSDSKCNYPCPSFPEEACGAIDGDGAYSVFNLGIAVEVSDLKPKASSTSATDSAPTSAETSSADVPASSESEAPEDDDDKKKSGPNTAAIAAGVVVGVVVVAGIVGGLFFYMRRRRNAEIEEDHRRNAAVNAFINGSKPPSSSGSISMTDSRLDPVLAHRRMSDGSIADNEDYSRRILRVTNA